MRVKEVTLLMEMTRSDLWDLAVYTKKWVDEIEVERMLKKGSFDALRPAMQMLRMLYCSMGEGAMWEAVKRDIQSQLARAAE